MEDFINRSIKTRIEPEEDDTREDRIQRVITDLEAAVYILDLSEQAKYVQEDGNRQMHRVLQELLIRNIERLEKALDECE